MVAVFKNKGLSSQKFQHTSPPKDLTGISWVGHSLLTQWQVPRESFRPFVIGLVSKSNHWPRDFNLYLHSETGWCVQLCGAGLSKWTKIKFLERGNDE